MHYFVCISEGVYILKWWETENLTSQEIGIKCTLKIIYKEELIYM